MKRIAIPPVVSTAASGWRTAALSVSSMRQSNLRNTKITRAGPKASSSSSAPVTSSTTTGAASTSTGFSHCAAPTTTTTTTTTPSRQTAAAAAWRSTAATTGVKVIIASATERENGEAAHRLQQQHSIRRGRQRASPLSFSAQSATAATDGEDVDAGAPPAAARRLTPQEAIAMLERHNGSVTKDKKKMKQKQKKKQETTAGGQSKEDFTTKTAESPTAYTSSSTALMEGSGGPGDSVRHTTTKTDAMKRELQTTPTLQQGDVRDADADERMRSSSSSTTAPLADGTEKVKEDSSGASPEDMQRLRRHYVLVTLQHRIQHLAHSFFMRFSEWRHLPAKRAVRSLSDELDAAIRSPSFDALSNVCARAEAMTQDSMTPAATLPMLRLLHARALTNFGVFCLVNFETLRAAELFQAAIHLITKTMTPEDLQVVHQALLSEAAGSAEGASHASSHNNTSTSTSSSSSISSISSRLQQASTTSRGGRILADSRTGRKSSASSASLLSETINSPSTPNPAYSSPAPYFSAETAVLYLRVLLANAMACEQQYWHAAEQLLLAVKLRQCYPLVPLVQLAPGVRGYQTLSNAFLDEELALFFKNEKGVTAAMAQGEAQLLLVKAAREPQETRLVGNKDEKEDISASSAHRVPPAEGNGVEQRDESERGKQASPALTSSSSSSSWMPSWTSSTTAMVTPRLPDTLLSLARLYRRVKQYEQSQMYFETYLESLVDHGLEDTQCVMQELGQMLLFSTDKRDVALVYLNAAAELLVEDAEEALRESGRAGGAGGEPSPVVASCCARAAAVLLDTSHALHANQKGGLALKMLDQCLHLLERAGLRQHSVWALKHSADLLCAADQVDRAVARYAQGIDVLLQTSEANEQGATLPQIGFQESPVLVKVAEIEGHLGHCLQTYVGDYKRALQHYHRALEHTTAHKISPVIRARQEEKQAAGTGGAPQQHSLSPLAPDAQHWVLGNMVDCYARIKDWKSAVLYQKQILQLEAVLGVTQTDSYLKMADLLQHSGDTEKLLALFFYLFFLPDEMLSPATRLVVAQRFGRCCYQAGNARMGAVLLQAVQKAQGGRDPVTLVEYALCLKHLDSDSEEVLRAANTLLPRDVETIGAIFRRAASLVVARRDIAEADRAAAAKAKNATSTDNSSARETATAVRCAEDDLNALMVLNRGAFFFLEIGQEEKAMDLYQTALTYCNETEASGVFMTSEYRREWSIVLANTAMLYARQPSQREVVLQLYEKAAKVCPTNLEVVNAAALYCQNEGLHEPGCRFLKQALQLPCEDTPYHTHFLLAQLGNSLFHKADPATKYLVLERILIALGLDVEKLPSSKRRADEGKFAAETSPSMPLHDLTEEGLEDQLTTLEPLLEYGVGSTLSAQAANLACFVLQMRFRRPQLLNRLFRIAITRFPCSHELLFNYANFCCTHQHHKLARKYFARSLALQESHAAVHGFASYLQHPVFGGLQEGNREQLLRGYAERHPSEGAAWCQYALLLSRSFPTPFKTESTFEAALRLEPQSLSALSYFAEFLCLSMDSLRASLDLSVRSQQMQRVEQLLRSAVEAAPSQSTTHFHLGVFYASADRVPEALAAFQRAVEQNPNDVDALRHIASLLKKDCERRKKEHVLQQHRNPSPSSSHSHSRSSGGSSSNDYPPSLQERVAQAEAVFERVLALEPHHIATLEEYAYFCVNLLNDPLKAKETWMRINRAKYLSAVGGPDGVPSMGNPTPTKTN